MFTEKAQILIDLAKDCAFAHTKEKLDIESLLAAVGSDTEAGVRLAECLTNSDIPALRAKCPPLGQPAPCPGSMDLTESLRNIIVSATELASSEGVPDRIHPGLIDVRHLVCAIALSREACRELGGLTPIAQNDATTILTKWYNAAESSVSIADSVNRLRGLRTELLTKVFGQDHAIHSFIEGLYNAEVSLVTEENGKRPTAVFVFAGPPGVGKTYMAELSASFMGRPFKRFDMTGYSDHQALNQLIGFAPSYKDAHAGLLTGFVEKNPNAVLLFDEIEKSHLNTIQLFHQILDAGHLEDKYTEHDVNFCKTIIIFTTNAGKSLYENPNKSGISASNSSYHKRTILSALENEKNSNTGQPTFPQGICSRLGQGYPIMFNHLDINELERVCQAELIHTETLLERQYFKNFSHTHLLPITLVLREGVRIDARQLRSEAEKFIKSELFKYSSLYTPEKLEDVFKEIDTIRFEIEGGSKRFSAEVRALFESSDKPKILLVANQEYVSLYQEHIPEIQWYSAYTVTEIIDTLSTEDIDMVLLDIWFKQRLDNSSRDSMQSESTSSSSGLSIIDQGVDFIPLSSRALDDGREILRKIHERSPQTPVYLLSFSEVYNTEGEATKIADLSRRPIDDELFLACVRAGGARGVLTTSFNDNPRQNRESEREKYVRSLLEITRKLYREKKARSLARERKILTFETSANLKKKERQLTIRLRSFSITRAIDALDAGEMVDEVERPNTIFEDIFGARGAKESLQFVVNWLKNPKYYAAMGIRPPKGVLLSGPPGTGKTMLARAIAGESDCAFIVKAASSFVTIWQGSGPQNVRDLFERARRYAPAVVFIDELDAIGTTRKGMVGAGRAQEETLNALLAEMDGFDAQSQQPVIVLAATNLVDQLDDALKRRFDRIIEVDKPDKVTRLSYLDKTMLQRKKSSVTRNAIENIAERSPGMTIADLERIVQQASVMAAQKSQPLTDELLQEAFLNFLYGEAHETPGRESLERTARHEAGHTLIYWYYGKLATYTTIVGRGEFGGFMQPETDEKGRVKLKSEIEQDICVTMGGRAAEMFYYGEEGGLSTGAATDLKNATNEATNMVVRYGMTDAFGQVSLSASYFERFSEGPLAEKVVKTAQQIVKQQLEKASEILKENRLYLDRLSEELLEKNRLTKEDLEKILPPIHNLENS